MGEKLCVKREKPLDGLSPVRYTKSGAAATHRSGRNKSAVAGDTSGLQQSRGGRTCTTHELVARDVGAIGVSVAERMADRVWSSAGSPVSVESSCLTSQ